MGYRMADKKIPEIIDSPDRLSDIFFLIREYRKVRFGHEIEAMYDVLNQMEMEFFPGEEDDKVENNLKEIEGELGNQIIKDFRGTETGRDLTKTNDIIKICDKTFQLEMIKLKKAGYFSFGTSEEPATKFG